MNVIEKTGKLEGARLENRVVGIAFFCSAVEGWAVVEVEFSFLGEPFGLIGVGYCRASVRD